jgi:cytochrome oxidase Cu insertion factor (SCO1/SenC/PrrC family)
MINLLSVCAVAGVGLLAMSAAAPGQQGQPPQPPSAPAQYSADLKVGDKAPDFALQGSDGKVHTLSDYKGKTVVLAWFPKAFTGG